MKTSEDEMYTNLISKTRKEIINNNFLTRTLFTAIQLKYKELEDEDENAEWNKNDLIKKIFDDFNKIRDKISNILDKKWKIFERTSHSRLVAEQRNERKNNK